MQSPSNKIICIMVAALLATQSVANDPLIEGSPELLDALKDGQLRNQALYPHGELIAEVEMQTSRDREPQIQYKVHVLWNGENSKHSVTGEVNYSDPNILKGRAPFRHPENIEIITRNNVRLVHHPDSKFARIGDTSELPMPRLTSVTPRQWWYGLIDGQGRPWVELLGPHPSFPQAKVKSYSVRLLDDDQVELIRGGHDGQVVRIVGSLLDGNIYYSEAISGNRDINLIKEYEWDGPFDRRRLISCIEENQFPEISTTTTYKLVEFNPDVRPRPEAFVIRPSALPPGTYVEDRIRGRNYRVGREEATTSFTDRLEELVEAMKSRGFAKEP